MKARVLWSVLGWILLAGVCRADRPARPNFVLILADDLGWQDLKCYDTEAPFSVFETPYIDALAAQGILFRQGYSPAPVCAPSRVGIICGKYPARAGKTSVVGGVCPKPGSVNTRMMEPYYTARMAVEEITIPEALGELGYISGHMGKWHMAVGHNSFPNALDQGFDWSRANRGVTTGMANRTAGFATTNPGDPYQLQDIDGQPSEEGFAYDQLTQDALDFLNEATTNHPDQPFFCYYASWLVHAPIHMRTERLLKKYAELMGYSYPLTGAEFFAVGQKNPYYAAMVETFDYHVHRIVTYLEQTDDPRWPGHKLIENTYIFLTSDNGGTENTGENVTDNYPLDQGKTRTEEGGVRVPFIVTGPGVPTNVVSEVMVNGLDIYPTILGLAGQPVPDRLDGCDLSALLLDDPQDPALVKDLSGAARDTMFWHSPHGGIPGSTIRKGEWKLFQNYDHVNNGAVQPFRLHQLYETNGAGKDIGETNNLVDTQSAIATQMAAELQAWLAEVGARFPSYNPKNTSLPYQSEVPSVVAEGHTNHIAWINWQTNKAAVQRVELLYTLNGNTDSEEWFCQPVAFNASEGYAETTIPRGTTHYVFNLTDANNFLVSSPDVGLANTNNGSDSTRVPRYVPNLFDFFGEWVSTHGLDGSSGNTAPELNTVGISADGRLHRDDIGFRRESSSAWTISRGIISNLSTSNNKVAEGALACMVDLAAFPDLAPGQITLSFEYTAADPAEMLYVHLWGYRDVSSTGNTATVNLGAQNGNAWESSSGALQAFNLGKPGGLFTGTPGAGPDAAAILTGTPTRQTYRGTFDYAGYDYLVLGFGREIAGAGSPGVTIQNVVLSAGNSTPLFSFVREPDPNDPLSDPDGDRRINLEEYALGSNPLAADDPVSLPFCAAVDVGGVPCLEHVHLRRRDAFERGLTYNVEFASDLASPAWTSQGVTQTGVGVVNADFESVTNCVPITPGSGFLRLNVSLDP